MVKIAHTKDEKGAWSGITAFPRGCVKSITNISSWSSACPVPSILKSMVDGLKNNIKGGKKILSETISINTVESEIAKPLEDVQNNFSNVEIGSYPFFRLGKIGVSIVIRSTEKKQIKDCAKQIQKFIQQKKIKIVETK